MKYLLLMPLVLLAVPAVATPVNLVANGDFETLIDGEEGFTFDAWTSNGYGWSTPDDPVVPAYEGFFSAATSCIDACSISQTLATVAGQHYTLSFAYNPGANADGGFGDTAVVFGGNLVDEFIGGTQGWSLHSYDVVASGSSTALTFVGYQARSANALDVVSVAGAVPEPATWAMMLGGLGLVGVARRRRTRMVAA